MRQEVLDKAREDPRGTPARILDAAEDVFAAEGYAGASMRDIARRADVPFGALHYHWGSKKQLWEAVFTRLGDRTRDTIMRNLKPGNTAGELIDNLVDSFLDLLISKPNTVRLAFRMALERDEMRLLSIRRMFADLARLGTSVFERLMPQTTIDPPAAIFVISAAFMGALADVDGQEDMLGGSVYTSKSARERLRAELKRVSRLVFQVAE
ncbi:MAG TPA: helix-turn-helix domain-containing protein [Candidatus Binatia bacterium]|nr:helix-turn-helix domain-containing protein [Candidatus Binatia bacterium]